MVAQNDGGQSGDDSEKKALSEEAIAVYREDVPEWDVASEDGASQLTRTFSFPDFAEALAFTNTIGALAESLNHHPTLVTEWGAVTVTWWSHDAGGLTKRDFNAAAETDRRYESTD